MSEHYLVRYCTPTLANIKIGNLFNFKYASTTELRSCLKAWSDALNRKGIYFSVLRIRNNKALIYVYRLSSLESYLKTERTVSLLKKLGYKDLSVLKAIEQLRQRINTSTSFPHEIGLFLGFHIEDVEGFILNSGKNSKYNGYWKVYGNVEKAKSLFEQYERCTKQYSALYNKGTALESLVV